MLVFPTPPPKTWEARRQTRDTIVTTLSESNNGVTLTGPTAVALELTETVEADIARASLVAVIAVLLLTWLSFRNVADTLLALVPMALGLVWALGILLACGETFHAMNLPMIPLIFGMGVDDGIHLTHRWRAMGRPRDSASIRTLVRSTGLAILLTSLTTIAGFGSLMFAQHRGLASMGLAVSVGMVTCLVASLVVWPCLVHSRERVGPPLRGRSKPLSLTQ